MFRDLKYHAKIELNGNYGRCFFAEIKTVAVFMLFFLYCLSSLYLFIFNTSFFDGIGVFKNQYTLAAACIAAVVTGFILLLFAYYVRYKKEIMYISLFEDVERRTVSISSVFKIIMLYDLIFIKKLFYTIVFLLPAILFSAFVYPFLEKGISVAVLFVLSAADMLLFASGILFAGIFAGRYSLCVCEYARNPEKTLRKIIKDSVLSMDGKCAKLFLLKICHIPKRIVSLLILPGIYFVPHCKATENLLLLGKANPYMSKRRYTEKPVVYYFEKRTT